MSFFIIFISAITFFQCTEPIKPNRSTKELPVKKTNNLVDVGNKLLFGNATECARSLNDLAHFPEPPKSTLHIQTEVSSAIHSKTYKQLLNEIQQRRNELYSILKGDSSTQDSIITIAKTYLFNRLTKDIFPYWYGTPWDFNGISNIPGQGKIACGYFVSTPLKHIGFNLNRYRVAQKGASQIIETISGKSKTKTFLSVKDLSEYLLQHPDGLYLVGLSCHVGFVEKQNDKIYFTHSNYLTPCEVIREDLITSPAINSSSIFVLGVFTLNDSVILQWLSESPIKV